MSPLASHRVIRKVSLTPGLTISASKSSATCPFVGQTVLHMHPWPSRDAHRKLPHAGIGIKRRRTLSRRALGNNGGGTRGPEWPYPKSERGKTPAGIAETCSRAGNAPLVGPKRRQVVSPE